jgi:transposase
LDEFGIDNNEEYAYGWGPKGQRVYGLKLGRASKRVSMIGALNRRKIVAPFVFEGYCNTELFYAYLRKFLRKTLKAGQTVIMDNASFHKSPKVLRLIKQAKCNLLYLPPYSPDFNPIEKKWFPLKNNIRKHLPNNNYDLQKCFDIVFKKKKT